MSANLEQQKEALLSACESIIPVLNMSDCDHEDFADSCADTVQELWIREEKIREAIAMARESTKPAAKFYLMEIEGGVEATLHGPFVEGLPRVKYEAKAQEIRRRQDRGADSLFGLIIHEDGTLTITEAPGTDCEDCTDCDKTVECTGEDFATPCGTYCDDCMVEHMKECEICRHEFKE